MLTQIEWWGGLIFVLGAITHHLVMGALETRDGGVHWYRLQMHAFFVLPAVVLAGYFYPLERTAVQYGYLGVLAASLVLALATLVQEVTGDDPQDIAGPANAQAKGGEAQQAMGPVAEEEETGVLVTVLGVAMLYSPVLVACGLGCYKAWPMVQRIML